VNAAAFEILLCWCGFDLRYTATVSTYELTVYMILDRMSTGDIVTVNLRSAGGFREAIAPPDSAALKISMRNGGSFALASLILT
jgi:hypothetical protein